MNRLFAAFAQYFIYSTNIYGEPAMPWTQCQGLEINKWLRQSLWFQGGRCYQTGEGYGHLQRAARVRRGPRQLRVRGRARVGPISAFYPPLNGMHYSLAQKGTLSPLWWKVWGMGTDWGKHGGMFRRHEYVSCWQAWEKHVQASQPPFYWDCDSI